MIAEFDLLTEPANTPVGARAGKRELREIRKRR
jgi:hypothetical protein